MKDKFGLKDETKERKTFEGGAMIEPKDGRGRFELISPFALMRLARVYQKGGVKYSPRNWETGEPYSRFIDSALRHITQYLVGMTDEDHLGQAAWNLFCVMHFEEMGRKDLDDLPHYIDKMKERQVNDIDGFVSEVDKLADLKPVNFNIPLCPICYSEVKPAPETTGGLKYYCGKCATYVDPKWGGKVDGVREIELQVLMENKMWCSCPPDLDGTKTTIRREGDVYGTCVHCGKKWRP